MQSLPGTPTWRTMRAVSEPARPAILPPTSMAPSLRKVSGALSALYPAIAMSLRPIRSASASARLLKGICATTVQTSGRFLDTVRPSLLLQQQGKS